MKENSRTPAGSPGVLVSLNPATGEVLGRFPEHDEVEVERRLAAAAEAFRQHRGTSFGQRAECLRRAAEVLETDKARWARIMTLEMGKPIRAAVQEVEKCAWACRYYAENGEGFLADEAVQTAAARSGVKYQPLGPVLAVMPWNFPFWQVFRFAAPALMAGNVALLKHASNVPQCALAIEEVFQRAGFSPGAFQTLLIGSHRVQPVIEDPRVRAVTLTGSVPAGRRVAAAAGNAIKKSVLELGGSDPFIVMPSADLERAVATAVQARTINNGQSCIAAKRFILDRRIAEAFEKRFVERMAALKVGNPLEETTELGPLATAEVLETLEQQVEASVRLGAKLLLGGRRLGGPGYFFPPTVLTGAPPGSPAYGEELFGPVAVLFRVDGMAEALRVANDTPFGLGACAWTRDAGEQRLFVEQVEAGAAFVNGMVASDPRLPFGGVKQSGYGRELSRHGILEFVNVKTVVVQEPAAGEAG
ncbi:MAG TPA: NAD-dependent succinate-semialdehyde dehydrogenase [Candidatus Paceibacterota bacterium]|nr:NAD-dependent succinate-semialdehyde dehydrogenase [Candidatus Paceibacterota bacterium]